MANYIYLDNYTSSKGKLGVSNKVFDSLVEHAVKNVEGCSPSKKTKKKFLFRLNSPIKTTIRQGIVHVSITVDAAKDANLQELSFKIQNDVNNILMLSMETVPFDVQVKFQSIIQ